MGIRLEDPDPRLEAVGLDIALGVGERLIIDFSTDEFPVRPSLTGEERVDARCARAAGRASVSRPIQCYGLEKGNGKC